MLITIIGIFCAICVYSAYSLGYDNGHQAGYVERMIDEMDDSLTHYRGGLP